MVGAAQAAAASPMLVTNTATNSAAPRLDIIATRFIRAPCRCTHDARSTRPAPAVRPPGALARAVQPSEHEHEEQNDEQDEKDSANTDIHGDDLPRSTLTRYRNSDLIVDPRRRERTQVAEYVAEVLVDQPV